MSYVIKPMSERDDDGARFVLKIGDEDIASFAVFFVQVSIHGDRMDWVADFKNRDDAIHFVNLKEQS